MRTKNTLNCNVRDISLITKEPVDITYDGQEAYLYVRLVPVKDDIYNEEEIYQQRIDLAVYEEITKEEGDNLVTYRNLVVKEEKIGWTPIRKSYAEMNDVDVSIRGKVSTNRDKKIIDKMKHKEFLKMLIKQDKPWGHTEDKWKVVETADVSIVIDVTPKTEEDLKQPGKPSNPNIPS